MLSPANKKNEVLAGSLVMSFPPFRSFWFGGIFMRWAFRASLLIRSSEYDFML